MRKIFQRSEFWIALVGVLIAACLWQFRLQFPFDDAFISFRYAQHLASGYGLVWNTGGPHTEGFTNFLFVVLLAVTKLFTNDLLASAQIIGIATTIVTGIVIYRLAAMLRSEVVGMLALSLYWAVPLTWVNALSGMETSLFAMLCLLAIYFVARVRYIAAFGFAFLAVLTRPEAALMATIMMACIVLYSIQKRQGLTAFLFAFAIPCIIYAVWKYYYFGTLLPNAFYIKVIGESTRMFPGLQYVRLFITSAAVLIALSLLIRNWRNVALLAAVSWAVFLTAFFVFVLPIEGLYDRFLWPTYSILCVMGGIGARDLASKVRIKSFHWMAIGVVMANIAVLCLSPRTQQSFAAHEDVWDANMDHVIRELTAFPHFDSLCMAYGDAGYVVYESGINHLDLFGLNDTRIAHARTVAARRAIVLSERPDIMLLPIRMTSDSSAELVEDAYGIARSGEFESCATIDAFPYTLALFINRKSPWYLDCRSSIQKQVEERVGYLRSAPRINY
jgi:arabinofuranosyltransferase